MSKTVIIVESPTKSKTINGYLGNDYKVISSMGHIRDLTTSGKEGLGLDFNNNLTPIYDIIPNKKKTVQLLKSETKGHDVLIATDPDREGEAIGWHIAEVLGLDESKANRIEFREITKSKILEGIKNKRPLDMNLIHSQEFRRALDRIIGFKLSSLLKNKIGSPSAGRVQSVALMLIVDLEKEIKAFKPVEYYDIIAKFEDFEAPYKNNNKKLSHEEAEKVVSESVNPFTISQIEKKEQKRKSKLPFTTSDLLQDISSSFGWSSERVMNVAHKLYEGVKINGKMMSLITYMRTDSTRLSNEFVFQAKKLVEEKFGKEYVGFYREKKSDNIQDAHEAIRPTYVSITPESLESVIVEKKEKDDFTKDEFRLYKRIYERAVASLMSDALYDITNVTLKTNNHDYTLSGSIRRFSGYQALYSDSEKDKLIPDFILNDKKISKSVEAIKKFTQPPARYTEATLIKDLEGLGIGRPSTYASTIKTLTERGYANIGKDKNDKHTYKKIVPSEQGIITTEALAIHFPSVINVDYTSKMEKKLDDIAAGKISDEGIIKKFYDDFSPLVEKAYKDMEKEKPVETDELCPLCGKPLVVRNSKYGKFLGCSGYPKCKYIKNENTDKFVKKS